MVRFLRLESVQVVAPISSCSAFDFRLLTFDLLRQTENFKSVCSEVKRE
jgi:hypothetical protein